MKAGTSTFTCETRGQTLSLENTFLSNDAFKESLEAIFPGINIQFADAVLTPLDFTTMSMKYEAHGVFAKFKVLGEKYTVSNRDVLITQHGKTVTCAGFFEGKLGETGDKIAQITFASCEGGASVFVNNEILKISRNSDDSISLS